MYLSIYTQVNIHLGIDKRTQTKVNVKYCRSLSAKFHLKCFNSCQIVSK